MNPMQPNLGDAILRINPQAKFIIRDENLETIEWLDGDIERPTDSEIMETLETLRSESARSQYRRQRAVKYPAIGDQLDDLFKAGLFSEEMASMIQLVKDSYPKPEGTI